MRGIVLWNAKGGVGKTTLAVNLAWLLGQRGDRVLLVDGDPQGSATKALGFPDPHIGFLGRSSAAALLGGRRLSSLVVATPHGFELVPGNDDLAAVDLHLALHEEAAPERLGHMRRAVEATRGYDWVVIDALPSLGLLSLNLLAAADAVVVPVEPESAGLRALDSVGRAVQRLQAGVRPDLRLAAVVVNRMDQRVGHHRDVEAAIRQAYGELVVTPAVRKVARIAEADAVGVPALAHADRDGRTRELRQALQEVVDRVDRR
jgi:chromosome partitioning protein